MKEKLKTIGKLSILFMFMITLFFSLLMISYLLPKEKIRNNLFLASSTFNSEGTYYFPFIWDDENISSSMMLDNFTDTLILDIIAIDSNNDETNIFKKTVLNSKYRGGGTPEQCFEEIFTQGKQPDGSYERYWFGSIAILKPLLEFTTYSTIRYLNMVSLFLLLFIAVLFIEKKIGLRYAISYAISFLLCGMIIIPMSLQFSPVFYLTLVVSIVILLLSDKKYFDQTLIFVFLIIGCLTSYLDLLTCPLLTYGIPIILVILLRNQSQKYTFKENLLFYFKLSMIWIIAYSLTYFAKWVIASIVLNKNVIESSWKQFMFRTDSTNEYNKLETIMENFHLYFNKYVLFLLAIFIFVNFLIIIKKKTYRKANYIKIVCLLIVGVAPYFWYIVLSNHSSIHFWMTYRIQAITMFAILSSIFSFYDEPLSDKSKKGESSL